MKSYFILVNAFNTFNAKEDKNMNLDTLSIKIRFILMLIVWF